MVICHRSSLLSRVLLILGHSGGDPCLELVSGCSPSPQYQECIAHPEANYVMFAIANFSNWLAGMQQAFLNCDVSVTGFTGPMVGQFYTAQTVSPML